MGLEVNDVDATLIMVFVEAGNGFIAEAGERLDGADIETNVLPVDGVIDCPAQFPASREAIKMNKQDNIVIDGSMRMVASTPRRSCVRRWRRNRKEKKLFVGGRTFNSQCSPRGSCDPSVHLHGIKLPTNLPDFSINRQFVGMSVRDCQFDRFLGHMSIPACSFRATTILHELSTHYSSAIELRNDAEQCRHT